MIQNNHQQNRNNPVQFDNQLMLLLSLAGAVGLYGIIAFSKSSPTFRAILIDLLKEIYGLKEWATEQVEKFIEDIEDIWEESKFMHKSEFEKKAKEKFADLKEKFEPKSE